MNCDSATTTQNSCVGSARANCRLCPASGSCLMQAVCANDVPRWNAGGQQFVSLSRPGKSLFEVGAQAGSIYMVRAGCLKSCTVDAEGNERVRGFHLPGDIIGLDALGAETYPCSVIAVVPSQVCKLSKAEVMHLLATSPGLIQSLLERTSRELAEALTLAGDFTAEQRVAAFLLAIQRRLGSSATKLRLPMPRRDIANYLRLATETVCRVLTRFAGKGWIESADKDLTFKCTEGLRQISASMRLGHMPLAPPLAA